MGGAEPHHYQQAPDSTITTDTLSLPLLHLDMAAVPQRTLNWLYSILIRVLTFTHLLYSNIADSAGPLRPQTDISRPQPDLLRRRQRTGPISLSLPANRCLQ